MKLTVSPGSFRTASIQIVAAFNDIQLEISECKDCKRPSLETKNGKIQGSLAVARYIAAIRADSGLVGKGLFEAAKVDEWVNFCNYEIEAPRAFWLLPVQGSMEFVGQAYAQSKKDIAAAMNVLNRHLLANTYLVGNQMTLADIVVASALVDMYRLVFSPGYVKSFGNVNRWFDLIINQESVKSVFGEVVKAKKEKFAPKPKKQPAKKVAAKPQQKKAAKKAPAPKPKPEKPDDELKKLPKSNMNLNTVKKLFWAKKPFNPAFFDTFREWYDPEGWSFWELSYNYNNDNQIFWISQNAVAGFTQRCDPSRKYGMGAIFLHSKNLETKPFKISGCYLLRGKDKVPKIFHENPDAEYYTYKKLDVSTPEGLERLKTLWTGETFDGDEVLDRRHFK